MFEERKLSEVDLNQIIISIVLISLFLIGLYIIGSFSSNPSVLYGALAAVFIPPAGKESIIPILIAAGINPFIIFLSIFLLDLTTCFIVLSSFEVIDYLVSKSSLLKREAEKIEKKVNKVERYDLVSLGLVGFMFLPFQGTGAITTSVLAQFFQLEDWKTVLVVIVGSVFSTFFFLGLSMGIIQLF